MSQYGDDHDRAPRGRGPPPGPYPPSMNAGDNYDPQYGRNGGYPPQAPGADVPPPPMGEQLNRQPSAMKREGSRSRVPHLRPEFPDEQSYLGSNAPDLEGKNRRRHKDFRDRRDGYESEEGETLRKSKPPGRGPPPDDRDRDRRRRGPPLDELEDRGPPPPYDERPPRHRRDRDRDRDREYGEEPSRRDRDHGRDRDRDRRRKDNLDVEYGSDPIPVRRSRSERQPYRPKNPRREEDEDIFSSDEDDRRGPPSRRRGKSQDGHDRRRRRDRDDYDDDRSDYSRRTDDRDRDRRRRDRSRRRYSDDESEYDDRDRRRRRDKDRDGHRKRDESPPKELKIGGVDVGPMLGGAQKHVGTLLPLLAPIVMSQMRKKFSK